MTFRLFGKREMIGEEKATLPHGGAIYKNNDLTIVRSITQEEVAEQLTNVRFVIAEEFYESWSGIGMLTYR
jgi:hypothetical protein